MITRDQVETWLRGIANGVLLLDRDNEGMARATLALIAPVVPAPTPKAGHLSPNFTLAELTYSDTAKANGIDNTPNAEEEFHLTVLAGVLEQIRHVCGDHPVEITSGFRCEALNAAVGGVPDSAHRYGRAADLVIPLCGSPLDVAEIVAEHVVDFGIDQLIYEQGGDGSRWVHVGLAQPGENCRHQVLSMNGGQYSTGLPA